MLTSLSLKTMAHDTVTRYTSVNPVTMTRYMNDSLRVLLDVFNNNDARSQSDLRVSGDTAESGRDTDKSSAFGARSL